MVAEKINKYMKDRCIKASPIAVRAGITQQQMSAILNGKMQLKADVFFRICKALDVPPETFDPGEGKGEASA